MCIVARVRFMPYGEETEDYYLVYCIYIDYPCIQLFCCCMDIVLSVIHSLIGYPYGSWKVILAKS